MVRQPTAHTKVPAPLHLDHGKSDELGRAAVDASDTSAMIDVSRESFEENLRKTSDIVEHAHGRGVHVKAELATTSVVGRIQLPESKGKA